VRPRHCGDALCDRFIEFIDDQGFKQLTKWRCSIKDGAVRRATRHAQFLTSAAVEIVMGTAACFYGVRG